MTRLSRIALTNIEREGEANDYTAAQAHGANIRIESADAELDFEEVKEEGGRQAWLPGCLAAWLPGCLHAACRPASCSSAVHQQAM